VVHRLDEMTVEAGLLRSPPVFVLSPSGECDEHYRLTPRLLPDPPTHLMSIQYGQTDVEQYHVRAMSFGRAQRAFTVMRHVYLMTM